MNELNFHISLDLAGIVMWQEMLMSVKIVSVMPSSDVRMQIHETFN